MPHVQKVLCQRYHQDAVLNNAKQLTDLRIPPNNRLEALKGNRASEYSIRVNDQWRICFRWNNGNAESVIIEDYH